MTDRLADKAKRPRQHWLLWWKIDGAELQKQVTEYRTLGPFKSARGISALCLVFSIVITLLFIAFKAMPISSIFDAIIMLVLAGFIYLGHRWAMIGAMVVWSLEKLIALVGGFSSANPNGGSVVVGLIWWCIYMHAFYLAFQVEQRRRKFDPTKLAAVF